MSGHMWAWYMIWSAIVSYPVWFSNCYSGSHRPTHITKIHWGNTNWPNRTTHTLAKKRQRETEPFIQISYPTWLMLLFCGCNPFQSTNYHTTKWSRITERHSPKRSPPIGSHVRLSGNEMPPTCHGWPSCQSSRCSCAESQATPGLLHVDLLEAQHFYKISLPGATVPQGSLHKILLCAKKKSQIFQEFATRRSHSGPTGIKSTPSQKAHGTAKAICSAQNNDRLAQQHLQQENTDRLAHTK